MGKVCSNMNDGVPVDFWHVWSVLKGAGRRNSFQPSIAGPNTAFQKEDKVRLLLDPTMYVATWPEVPSEEVFKSCPTVHLQTGEKVQMLLHKRRVSQKMCVGEEPAPLCKECRKCLVKNPPEMPSRALANGTYGLDDTQS